MTVYEDKWRVMEVDDGEGKWRPMEVITGNEGMMVN